MRNPNPSSSPASMAPPPHPNPSPPTARPEAASDPDLTSAEVDGRAGSSASSSMQLPPPPKPGPSAPHAEAETAGAEGSAVPSPSVGASSGRDPPNTSGVAAASPLDRQSQQRGRAPYAIPDWSAAPSKPYFVDVLKEGVIIEKIDMSKHGAYMFGRSERCDAVLLHHTISRFHAVIQFKYDGRIFLYDVGSVHGSFINQNLINKKTYKEIHVGDVIQFGESSRLYIFRGPSESMPPITNTRKEIVATASNNISQGGPIQVQQTQSKEQQISHIMKPANGDSIQESAGSRSGKVKHDIHKANRYQIEEDTLSSELENVQTKTRGADKQLILNANSVRFSTPQSKSLSNDIKRDAFSVGTKRSSNSMDYAKIVKCKRSLFHDSTTTSRSEVTLAEFATYGVTQRIKVPFMSKKVKMGKEGIKLVLLNSFGLLVDLHCQRVTLKGSFSLENFLVWPRTKQVTLCGIEPKPYSSGDDTLDKSHFVRMVKEMFRGDLPDDVRVWLNCIENGGSDSVLRRNINMLHSDAVFGEFCIMYHSMLEQKDLDMKKFIKLLSKLEDYDEWEKGEFTWCILQANRSYRDPNHSEPASDFRDSVFGLMQQLRNCWHHPAKIYKQYLLAVILCDHPSLLSDVQEALYAEGCLPHLDTKNLD